MMMHSAFQYSPGEPKTRLVVQTQNAQGLLKANTHPTPLRFGDSPIPQSQKVTYQDLGALSPKDLKALGAKITLLQKLEGRLSPEGIPQAFYPHSITNQLWEKLYPRENGVILYAGALEDESFQQNKAVAFKLGSLLAKHGKHVVTAGGPGYMRVVSEGAVAAGGHTVACNLKRIPDTDPSIFHEIYYHDTITDRMNGIGGYESRGSYTIALPGGFGTLHELLQKANELWYGFSPYATQKAIILMDLDGFYEKAFLPFLDESIRLKKTKAGVRDLFKIVHTPEEALQIIENRDIPWAKGVQPVTTPSGRLHLLA